jgi:hypothetical protein
MLQDGAPGQDDDAFVLPGERLLYGGHRFSPAQDTLSNAL